MIIYLKFTAFTVAAAYTNMLEYLHLPHDVNKSPHTIHFLQKGESFKQLVVYIRT